MGTRHLTMVLYNNKFVVAQYGQWDGYPEGAGVDILKFLQERFNKEAFIKNLSLLNYYSTEDVEELWEDLGSENGLATLGQSDNFRNKYITLHRDCGSDILSIIQDATSDKIPIHLQTEFAGDSLFCEWAYILNLDNDTLEIYKGFQKSPREMGERFAYLNHLNDNGYWPIKMLGDFDIKNLPDEKRFLASIELMIPREDNA